MSTVDEATRRQLQAARPDASTWLSANAGSGKTRVLTDRVARLLLDGVAPQHILCLTYTKTAAFEMQNRLFKRLGAWAMLPDAKLIEALEELGIDIQRATPDLRRARTLFASAIETPGGLKIQTIHSFCSALLRRFPLEAKVSPQFTEIEDRAADLLRAELVDQMADGPDAAAVAALAKRYTGEDFTRLTKEIVSHSALFQKPVSQGALYTNFGLSPGFDEDTLAAEVFLGGEEDLTAELTPALIAKGGEDAKAGFLLREITQLDARSLGPLENVFLTKGGAQNPFSAKIGRFPTKATRAAVDHLMPALEALMQRVEQARPKRLALAAVQRTQDLHQFAVPFVQAYTDAKLLRGWLDFDDLIHKARDLLHDPRVAAWVLYRIDGGIDHILVDEAQDTSPAQWDVVRKLSEEFASGDGARADVLRTIFVVGDTKQSIYSFQGADPREFHRMQQEFQSRISGAGQPFQNLTLDYSFRSSPAILRMVDQCFDPTLRPSFAQQTQHIAFKSDLPGRVDLWPVIEPQAKPDETPWYEPVDRLDPTHHHIILAEKVADQIADMIAHETIPDNSKDHGLHRRPVKPGDFLILVQQRKTLFSEIIRACKERGLPIAGADRLKVGGELAVKDITALLSFLATPEDSLSLAATLRSPLFEWSEQDLFDLAHRRTQTHLWPALRDRQGDFPETFRVLNDLRDNIDFLRPYELIERILTRHGGRQKLLARLGTEAEDGINALLAQALGYERTATPSLTGFLVWMKADNLEIKRQIDSASDQIRVMTVHGSKGLESPIVILPDTAPRKLDIKNEIIDLDDMAVWRPKSDATPPLVQEKLDQMKISIAEERLRLLYVALTRAEKWLIVAAAGDLGKTGDSWYEIAQNALLQINAVETQTKAGKILRFEHGSWHGPDLIKTDEAQKGAAALWDMFRQKAPEPGAGPTRISPSNLGGAKALPGEAGADETIAMAFGSAVHMLLERLLNKPRSAWDGIAKSCRALFSELDDAHWAEARTEAKKTLNASHLEPIFSQSGLSEVPVTAQMGDDTMYGIIDRLLINGDQVLAVDYKTNRVVPHSVADCPDGLLRQMGAYHLALQQVFPSHRIEVALLWTKDQSLMPLPQEVVTSALNAALHLDAQHAET